LALSAFDDKSRSPEPARLRATLGPAAALWRKLLSGAAELDPDVVEAWNFAGPRYGWSLRVKQKERVVLHMTPCSGHFLAGIVLGEKTIAQAQAKGLPKPVLEVLEATPRYAEGRGIRHEVSSEQDLRVVLSLLELKMPDGSGSRASRPSRRPRPR
jgi:hypothetical protein